MKRRFCLVPLVVCAVAVAVSCGKSSPTPSTPSSAIPGEANANADGSNLKATAPTPQSPVNGARPDAGVTLVVGNSSLKFANAGQPLSYRFEIYNSAGNRVYQSGLVPAGGSTTTHDVQAELNVGEMHSWQARPEYLGTAGPWSARTSATFIAPDSVGFMKGNELYDPLTQGKTKFGNVVGPHQWIPGVGLKLLSHESHVSYQLPATCSQCEMSVITSNVIFNTKGGKTKIMCSAQGYDDIVTNDRRMTVEKRGDPPGIVAWRIITHGDQADTEGAEREQVFFDPGEDVPLGSELEEQLLQPPHHSGHQPEWRRHLRERQGFRGTRIRPEPARHLHRRTSRPERARRSLRAGRDLSSPLGLSESASRVRQQISPLASYDGSGPARA